MNRILLTGVATLAFLGASIAHAGPVTSGGAPTGPGGGVPQCDPDVDEDCTPTSGGSGDGGTGSGGTGTGTGSGSGGTTPAASAFGSNVTLYSTRALFNAAASNVVTDGFEIASPTSNGIGVVKFNSAYTDPNGVSYTVPVRANNSNSDLNVLDSTYLNGAGTVGSKFGSDVLESEYYTLTITLPHAVNAFALDFGSQGQAFANKADTFNFAVNGLGSQDAASNGTGLSFFGFTSSTAFDTIVITTGANTLRFYDNVSFGDLAADAVPEPAMLGLFGMGAVALGASRRRRK